MTPEGETRQHARMTWLHSILGELLALVATRGPAPSTDGCVVQVADLPVPARAHHELVVSSRRMALVGERLAIDLDDLDVKVTLVGPRYGGELPLDAGRCTGGRTHVLAARPLPAAIEFTGPRELVVRCEDGPEALGDKWWLAHELPPIDVGHGVAMTCEFKSPGYRPGRQRLRVAPGENTVDVELEQN